MLLALVFGVAAPAAGTRLPLIESGVTVLGENLGGMTAVRARAKIKKAFERPVRFGFYQKTWRATPHQLGAHANIDRAVSNALDAERGERVTLDVWLQKRRLRKYVAHLDRLFSRPMENARLAGLVNLAPVITESRIGRKVKAPQMEANIERSLRTGDRRTIGIELKPVLPTVTEDDFHSIIVIRRGSNQLYLYDGSSLVRTFRVATGTAKYPTPLGQWSIVDMQRNPWWYPPPDSEWSKDLKPVPPGPGNPLGTRWMGLSAPAVGIHGTPDAKSIGYSASHGCIRMLISEADWLFEHVDHGTPVFIVAA